MSIQERVALASKLKTKGNTAYQQKNFPLAIKYYTRAIETSPKPDPVYYSNRAACYVNSIPPQFDMVVKDCDEALKLDPSYVKALNRRGTALESLGRFEEAVRDFTAATILDKFQNESSSQAVERVLKKLTAQKMREILENREPRLPSVTFISAYLAAFRARPLIVLPENPSTGDETLLKAIMALEAGSYAHAFTLVQEAIEQGISWDAGKAESLNLRGTFKFLMGDSSGAKDDLQASLDLDPTLIQSWVKIASVHMELSDPEAAFNAFNSAISYNPNDSDIYYHRGQVNFILREFTAAEEDYAKSVALDDNFVFSHIQYAVAQYKNEKISASMETFRKTMKQFPDRSEPQNYYGELLLDQERFEDAVEKFDRALEIESHKTPPTNVLPLVNKALALYQWKSDVVIAEKLCREALEIDPECDAAIATLSQLTLQQGRLADAVEFFERHTKIARTEPELEQTVSFMLATRAQLEFIQNYPHMAAQLGAIAQSLQQ
ncbi:hypothetical protein BOTBODRAFT_112628 [Botryobasidium botryosum FD-172 SS1]|uniref:Mitochondrial outer membrane translocase receptor TOM70 n=1 Tax=Botryobasidium botryosum (strain FD-172 SS1) TaxID=930990 RepID=A0A067MKZ5_BOTB1|nr:hypothetical protein BOTBODRAFT_112628 [Botryobasidium botryosum FD-172 SS1]